MLSAISSALDKKFGEGLKEVLFWNFEKETKLGPLDIPRKPQEFVKCLYKIFGVGAKVIEDAIKDSICAEFNIESRKVAGLTQAIEIAKSNALKSDLMD